MNQFLSVEQIQELYQKFQDLLTSTFSSTRLARLQTMYENLGNRLLESPASSKLNYHNCFPGGYLDHILRVTDFALKFYEFYRDTLQLRCSDFTQENLVFVALHHDLGKLGMPDHGREGYVQNPSEWHRKNQLAEYVYNTKNEFCPVPLRSLFLLQHYDISISWVEYLGILIHDGLYEDANKPFYISHQEDSKLRSNLPIIIHNADYAAAKFEYERWKFLKGKPESREEKKSSSEELDILNVFKNFNS